MIGETFRGRFARVSRVANDAITDRLVTGDKVPSTPKGIEQVRAVGARAIAELEQVDPSDYLETDYTAAIWRASGGELAESIPPEAVLWARGWAPGPATADGWGCLRIPLVPRDLEWRWPGGRQAHEMIRSMTVNVTVGL